MRIGLVGLLVAIAATPCSARDRAVAMEFQAANPCPSTGQPYGPCPGYIRDHIWPLCAGGADAVQNMQWQTVEAAKVKDRWELSLCRAHRAGVPDDAAP